MDEHLKDEGGESACFAHLVCPECGAVVATSNHHLGCPNAALEPPSSTTDDDERTRDGDDT